MTRGYGYVLLVKFYVLAHVTSKHISLNLETQIYVSWWVNLNTIFPIGYLFSQDTYMYTYIHIFVMSFDVIYMNIR